MDHMSEEDRQKHLEEENKPLSFLMNLFEKKKLDNKADNANFNDVYRGMTAADYLNNSLDNALQIGMKFFLFFNLMFR